MAAVNMGSTWVLSAPDGPHVGPMNLAIRACALWDEDFLLEASNVFFSHFIKFEWGVRIAQGINSPLFFSYCVVMFKCPCSFENIWPDNGVYRALD